MPAQRGFTLFELLAALAITAILFALAVPSLGKAVSAHRTRTDAMLLYGLVRLARQQAVMGGNRTVLCVLDGNGHCGRDWDGAITLFADRNRNNRLDDSERTIRTWSGTERDSDIRWHGFGIGYLRYRATGTAVENGTFDICPADGDRRLARQVVINRVGRAYWSNDRDGDGIVEHGRNREPSCN